MNFKFAFVLSILLLSGFASAGYYYSDDAVYYKEKISASYYNDDYSVTRTVYADYDNEDRYSTYDYRWGYSYRDSSDYWMNHHDYVDYDDVLVIDLDDDYNYDRYDDYYDYDDYDYRRFDSNRYHRNNRYHDYRYDNYYDYQFRLDAGSSYGNWKYVDQKPRVQARYVSYLDEWETRECYDYAPRGKLFYIECD